MARAVAEAAAAKGMCASDSLRVGFHTLTNALVKTVTVALTSVLTQSWPFKSPVGAALTASQVAFEGIL